MPILSTGEVLWDIFAGRELLGGAPLNFSITLQRLGHTVSLVTAVGADARGEKALEEIRNLGLSTGLIQVVSTEPTGTAAVTTDDAGNPTFVLQRPAAFDRLIVDDDLFARIGNLNPSWMYFGTLAQIEAQNEALVRSIVARLPSIRRFYDINLREGRWNLPLVQRLSALASVLKLNDLEAQILHDALHPGEPFSLEQFCRRWSETYGISILCVTRGSEGCAVFEDNQLRLYPGFKVEVVDTVGAGDAFAAAFLHGLLQGWPAEKRARFANAAGAIVATQAGANAGWNLAQIEALMS